MAMKTRILNEIEFTQPGEVIEGRLISAETIRYRDGSTNVTYLVKGDGRGIMLFRGSSMLNKLLFADDIGKMVIIKYVGLESKDIPAGMSPRKIFDVQVDEDSKLTLMQIARGVDSLTDHRSPPESYPNGHANYTDPGITDADIPF